MASYFYHEQSMSNPDRKHYLRQNCSTQKEVIIDSSHVLCEIHNSRKERSFESNNISLCGTLKGGPKVSTPRHRWIIFMTNLYKIN